MPTLACRRSGDQPTRTVSLSPPPLECSTFPLPKTARSGQPGHFFFCCTNQPYPYHPRPSRERKLTGKSVVEWFEADEDTRESGTSHTDYGWERFRDPFSTMRYHKNITEMQEQDRLFSSKRALPSSAAFGRESYHWALDA